MLSNLRAMLQSDDRLMHNKSLLFYNLKVAILFWRGERSGLVRKGPTMRGMAHADRLLDGVKITEDGVLFASPVLGILTLLRQSAGNALDIAVQE